MATTVLPGAVSRKFSVLPGGIHRAGQNVRGLQVSLRRGSQQLRQADQIVGGRRQRKHPAHPRRAAIARLALATHRLHPTKHLFDALPMPYAHLVTAMASGAAVNGGTAV